jgi:hypothetical protein
MNHHPDIEIRLTKVPLKLTTHDEGGITKKVSPVPGDAMRCRREFWPAKKGLVTFGCLTSPFTARTASLFSATSQWGKWTFARTVFRTNGWL